jgi:predicted acetyltransferase
MSLYIHQATASERPLVDNLLQYYLHDFSEFTTVEIDAHGRFVYPYLAHYWQDPDRWPLLIRHDGHIIGLALVRQNFEPTNGRQYREMAEFFILRSYRRLGRGCAAARLIFEQFSGAWQIPVLHSNPQAQTFWQAVMQAHVGGDYQRDDNPRAMILCFEQTAG